MRWAKIPIAPGFWRRLIVSPVQPRSSLRGTRMTPPIICVSSSTRTRYLRVIVRDIPFSSMCEHHILPFTGKAHVAYIPRDGRITGLSKIARCVSGFAHRLQLQERLTAQIADAMMDELEPFGVLVVLEAEHTCMTMRASKAPAPLR